MKLTKKIEAEITSVYDTYWKALLIADIDTYTSVLDEKFKLIGTTESEVFFKSIEAIQFLEATADQVAGNIELRNRIIKIELIETIILITEQSDTYVKIDGNWSFYGKARVSTLIGKKNQEWKIIQMHLSFPDSKADEGQTIGLDKISKENLELRDAIKRRTIELENKNRELEIETALEKVRAVAMGMNKADDMLSICKTISQQLTQLGVKEIRNVQTAIFYESRGTYMNYEYYAKHDKTFITEVDFKNHKIQLAFAKKMLKGPNEEVLEQLKGKKLQDWYTYQKSTNQFADKYLLKAHSLNYYWYSLGPVALGISTYFPLTIEETNLFKRFLKVFELAYRRYLDIEKATAQAREAQIEVALERVRSRAIAMHKSDELKDIAAAVHEQLQGLGFTSGFCSIVIMDSISGDMTWWMFFPGKEYPESYRMPFFEHPFYLAQLNNWKQGKKYAVIEVSGKEKKLYDKYTFSQTEFVKIPIENQQFMMSFEKIIFSNAYMKHGAFSWGVEQIDEEHAAVLQRFAIVFEQCYTRFLDLQKAEAQTREAQIEAALEKVRSVAMSMHHSNELLSICEAIYVELLKLNITELRNTMINIHNDADETFLNYDYSAYAGKAVTKYGYHIHPIISQLVMQCRSTHDAFVDIALDGEEFQAWRSFRKSSGEKDDKRLNSIKHLHYYFYSIGIGSIGISTFESIDNDKLSLLKRFRNVFQLAYQRFTDLLAAETQAREAQIESSLERVRSKTMAMHNSDDVGETVATLFDELVKLGVQTNRCGILICGESKTHAEVWTAKSNPDGNATLITGQLELNMHPLIEGFYRSWKKKKEVFSYALKGDDMVAYYKAINNSKYYPTNFNLKKLPEQEVHTDFYFSDGAIFSFSPTSIDDATSSIFKRFANVFGQTYRRYLDLQKAESSARESQIEAALERVRGKAMAMHSSNDLSIAANTVFTELKLLGLESFRSGVGLLNKNNRKVTAYITTSAHGKESLDLAGEIELTGHESYEKQYQAWLNNEMYVAILEGDEMDKYYSTFVKNFSIVESTQNEKHEKEFGYYLPFSEGLMYSWSTRAYTENEIIILNRFKTIIDLTFRRYIELQKAEANALEALRSASLDRVRAEIASMRTTNDLEKITPLIWKELKVLNIPFVRCGVFIMDEQAEMIHTFLSTPDGKAIASLHLPYTKTPLVNSIEYWRDKKLYQTHWGLDTYAVFADAIADETTGMNKEHYLSSVPKEGIHLHLLPFLQGMLYVGNTEPLSEDNLSIIQSVADAFSTAYARYEDFIKLEDAKKQIENTLTDLQAAQKQLIQSEKMASLGELTAGIAHEIQNPLNFVNNFSEVSSELISEMVEEVDKGNFEEVKAIADDVKQNLEKINHHGQRAADIVKGMLQHSRSSNGVKEPTDINALADEYLRLAYHGLRAKDKTFNASMKTDFDESIGKVNVIPQDIGRVVLNLITNAFYVVNEKKKSRIDNYEPRVSVSTKRDGNKVLVSVKDNGNGIPPKILDKIFQPFFTTKPTGQGTGLGLSLSYDIVKAHGGELKVETKEGEGTEFSIVLSI